ncbi:AMP-binding protein [Nesterenkonia sp. CL21]|uniref:AMP-binding protein n=1 Tax=Nesterenkonia sp. CL21 TaxID=3064894 RepID=UPI002878D6CF|nr:AMP-binding protein [Nesterenkonia sp. CL21]MDS2173739.1 AMP-binding protein [Nesterenkonia sp. CL21]
MSGVAPEARAVNLSHALTQIARRLPAHDAIIQGDDRWSWQELDARCSAVAEELARRGVGAGDCVMLDGPNSPEYIQAMYGVWRAGATVAPVNSRLHPAELAGLAEVCQPTLMIAHSSTATHVAAVRAAVPGLQHLWLDDGPTEEPDGRPESEAPQDGTLQRMTRARGRVVDSPRERGDHAWYFFTSGTSGRSKAAVLSHDQLGFVVTNHLADLMPGLIAQDRSIVVAPLSHGAGIHLLSQVSRGAATVLPTSPRLDAAEIWKLVEREKVTNTFTVPTILKRLVEAPEARSRDHSSLRHVIYAGAPMPSPDLATARETLGDVLVQYYGLGEVTGNITVLPADLHDHPSPPGVPFSTCGLPRTGMEISVQDDDGRALPALEPGEICVAGPAVFAGYLNNPTATRDAFRNGWFRTGDVGLLDESGFLFLTGRVSDMYISGGSNIHPREIEEHILQHKDIRETVVLGMPDPEWGEVGVAVCVRRADTHLTGAELRDWLRERTARYKVPRHVVFWEDLPRSGYGKIVRRTVREKLLLEGFSP